MGVSPLWKRGFMGQGVKVALLDTGMTDGPRPVKHLGAHGLLQWLEMARTGGDTLGHGTFTASMIAGSNPLCLGIAPEATIIPYKVVTDEQRSQTKGFLEALTDAIDQAVHIIVLPIGGTVITPTPPHCKPLLTPTPCQRGFTRIHAIVPPFNANPTAILTLIGPDYLDDPFNDKINEAVAAGIVVIAAAGDEGPGSGSITNPGDLPAVIAVGSVDLATMSIPAYSGRGLTRRELVGGGSGRFKPDLVAPGHRINGNDIYSAISTLFVAKMRDVSLTLYMCACYVLTGASVDGGCELLSGTGVAAGVAAGVVAVLLSSLGALPAGERGGARGWNPGMIRQALIGTADRLPGAKGGVLEGERGASMVEQGAGVINATRAVEWLASSGSRNPHASAFPPRLAIGMGCARGMWPYCLQPLYADAMPVVVNVTLLSSLGSSGYIAGSGPIFIPGENGEHLRVSFSHHAGGTGKEGGGGGIQAFVGTIGVHVRVKPSAAQWRGIAYGTIQLTVAASSPTSIPRESSVSIPFTATVIPTPERKFRVLWDTHHSLGSPSVYTPRDTLPLQGEQHDDRGDHPWTNYGGVWRALSQAGYAVEVLAVPWTCIDAARYGSLVLVDSEDRFTAGERSNTGHRFYI